MIINGVESASCSADAKTLSTVQYQQDDREITVAIGGKLEKRCSLHIDLNALPPDESPPPPPAAAVQRNGTHAAPAGENTVLEEDGAGRTWRLWEALIDAAAICLHAYGGEELEFRTRGERRMVDALAVEPPPVLRSKRGRVVALPNRYKDSVVGAAVDEEFLRRGKSAAAIGSAVSRKYRRM